MSTRNKLFAAMSTAIALRQGTVYVSEDGKTPVLNLDWIAEYLLEAGWRPPMRVIETVEELEALPVGAVIFNRNGEALQIQDNYGKEFYYAAADETPYGAHFLFEAGDGPFRVVWEPEQ